MYNVQTHFPRSMHRDEGSEGDTARIRWRSCEERDWASSEGGPGLCLGLDNGERTTLGTIR